MLSVITMASNSIAAELMELINTRKYKDVIPVLPNGAGLSEDIFPKTILAKTFTLDTEQWLDGSYMNPNAMFELFGSYSNETGMQTRKKDVQVPWSHQEERS